MSVKVHWNVIKGPDDPRWQDNCGVYAYMTPSGSEILYLGKVDGCTVRQRWNARDKESFWRALENQRHIFHHVIIVGDIILTPGFRLSSELLSDVESLLIHRVRPWGNIACLTSRISRPGMRVRCTGDWPLSKKTFLDAQLTAISMSH